ncbi:MAG: Spx/MgsR family RNA polymerase-binding regulatory protein [Rhizobiales bacterium]|nr:Spx/MgsR family RNA polymerase-binding regulatory protein [Hyphomicrobiales bacterium]
MITVYGLKTCDTCRKALAWLEAEGIAYRYIDVRKDGVSAKDLKRFAEAVGHEALLNKSSTTWRGLSDAQKSDLSKAAVLKLLEVHPTLMKRPVFETGKTILVGFKEPQKTALQACA